ncbi:STAS domain-containing protein [Roseateles sp. GG27B]
MSATMLQLPGTVRMNEVPALWLSLRASLRAEAAQVKNAAGREVNIGANELQHFDSAVLTLLLSAARLCADEDVQLRLHDLPPKLQDLGRVYGVAELLWPEQLVAV